MKDSNSKGNMSCLQWIPFSKPSLDRQEYCAVQRVLESNWLTTGKECHLFETEFLNFLKQKSRSAQDLHTIAVQSASAGLHLSLKALGVKKGDKVVTTPYTFVSTVSAILHCGAQPVFIDCEKDSFFMDCNAFDILKTDNSFKVFLPVHISGCAPSYFKELCEIARKKNLVIVEDASHTFPAYDENGFLGTQTDIGVYSFYANKTITTGEGGMVVCNDAVLAQKMLNLRNHGIDKEVWRRFTDSPSQWDYDIINLGYKYNLPDLLATIGREQLKKATQFQLQRRDAANYYIKKLSKRDYWILPPVPKDSQSHSWHLFILQIKHPNLTRNAVICEMKKQRIGTSVHYKPLHLMTYYKNTFGYQPNDFPQAVETYKRVVSLPLYAGIHTDDLERICNTLITIGDAKL